MLRQLNQTLEQRSAELAAVNQALHLEITKRKRHEQQLAGQYRVSRILAESASLDEAAAKILQAVCESVEWDLGDIWIIDRQVNTLRCVEIWHSPSVEVAKFEAITRQIRFPPGVGLPGRVWVSGEPAWIPDVSSRMPTFPVHRLPLRTGCTGPSVSRSASEAKSSASSSFSATKFVNPIMTCFRFLPP